MSEQQKYWFAARTRDKQEFAIRDSLEKLKTELDLNYYLPTQFVIRQLKYRRKRVEVLLLRILSSSKLPSKMLVIFLINTISSFFI